MFESFVLCDDGFQNVVESGAVTGFRFLTRINYYRGIPLSMVENVAVTVDGEAVERGRIRFSVGEDRFTLEEMTTVTSVKWEFGQKAAVYVEKPGGLAPGPHRLGVEQTVRVAYIPFPLRARNEKVLKIS